METKVNYALVGAFVLGLLVALIAGVLWLASGGGFQKKYDSYLSMVNESVAGLNLNAPVKYRGVDVGKVSDIKLDPVNPAQVRLIFAIEHGTPIKESTTAMLKTQGLTGIAYVELDGGTADSPPLRATEPGRLPEIPTKPSLSARLENVIGSALIKLEATSDSLNKLLGPENLAAFKSTLADLSLLARTVAAHKTAIDSGIENAARTLENSARLTRQLDERLVPVIERIGKATDAVRKMSDQVAVTSAGAGKTVDSVGADVKRFSADTLPEIQGLLGELNVLTTSLRHLIEETERNPRGFLFGRKPVPAGPGEGENAGSVEGQGQ